MKMITIEYLDGSVTLDINKITQVNKKAAKEAFEKDTPIYNTYGVFQHIESNKKYPASPASYNFTADGVIYPLTESQYNDLLLKVKGKIPTSLDDEQENYLSLIDILGHVDYTGFGGCKSNEILSAVLPVDVLTRAHKSIDKYREKNGLLPMFYGTII